MVGPDGNAGPEAPDAASAAMDCVMDGEPESAVASGPGALIPGAADAGVA